MKSRKCTCCGTGYTPSITSHDLWCANCAAATEKRRGEIAAERERKEREALEQTIEVI